MGAEIDRRINCRAELNGVDYRIDAATTEVFGEWLAGICRLVARGAGPATRFVVHSMDAYDAARA